MSSAFKRTSRACHCAMFLGLLAAAACGGSATRTPPASGPKAPSAAVNLTLDQQIERGNQALEVGRYKDAKDAFEAAKRSPDHRVEAELGLRRVYVTTGRYELAATPSEHPTSDRIINARTLGLRAMALSALGQLDEAANLLRTSSELTARVELGRVLIARGKRAEASDVLMSVIEDYNSDRIKDSDADSMALVGRAAFLLRSPEDANDAFNLAEQAPGHVSTETLLWRAELFLEHHDTAHAEEVLLDVLERNPHHPEALVGLAKVKLDQALDFEEARRLVGEALATNPRLTEAHAVLASVALYDMQIAEAEAHIDRGLRTNPRDLTLLSLRGAAKFLADDLQGFNQTRDQVLSHNPEFARFFSIVGTYAEWEHRYDDIVGLMNQALAIDPHDAKLHAQLGINLIRNGDDTAGLLALRTAFRDDPYDVRVYNTLHLYEKTIPQKYVSVPGTRFNFRFAKLEKPVLERVVPGLLDAAWNKMVRAYAFEPSTPIGIELYAERESFAVRTSGLPHTAIQGVCFGKTLASMSPYYEKFNVGMTLWHELAHVFHIQLSKNHVPRWFTEGLAEYETLTERVEWRREQDQELYVAFSEGRLPKVSAMNEAFTHAEDLQDVAVAYYASTQIVHMLAETYGYPKLREMLVAWGQGLPTANVVTQVLGLGPAELDARFEAFLSKRLARYNGQFVPSQRVGNPERVRKLAAQKPRDPDAQSRLALLLLENKQYNAGAAVVKRVLELDPKHAYGLWLHARVSLRQGNAEAALASAKQLVTLGKDGYETQLLLSKASELAHDQKQMETSLRKAHDYDPMQAEPLYGLLAFARRNNDTALETQVLAKLVTLEEHNGAVFRELARALITRDANDKAKAVEVGQSAVYAELYDPASHVALASAYEAVGKLQEAVYAFDTALLAPGSDGELIDAHKRYAEFCKRHGMLARAKQLEAQVLRLEAAADQAEE